ncbi:hypothetical protein PILCRDRAFT_813251 [Piloderma croceum F 1598]|uniref:Uncharacterized protein n=1 Tax=Piloderma croceum (strain F 1598) TaxID=765440 RepID=A0A0C3CHQ7_PILCF|nr:hypothetical protein PILCRDRAFT_813251 [Piloderma croceum F 1598]
MIQGGEVATIPSSLLTLPMILVVIKTLCVRPLFKSIGRRYQEVLPNIAILRLTSSPTFELQQQEVP